MVILGLGSNIGDRVGYLGGAVKRISGIMREMRLSRIMESPALLPPEATPDMDRPFLNMAVSGKTDLSPQELLSAIKAIERELGRVQRCIWGPREIDIDILAMGDRVMASGGLTIPHCRLLERDFVLLPVGDVAPAWRYPVAGPYHHMLASEIAARKGFTVGGHLRETGLTLNV